MEENPSDYSLNTKMSIMIGMANAYYGVGDLEKAKHLY